MRCGNCGHDNPENAIFCAECGTRIVKKEPVAEKQVFQQPIYESGQLNQQQFYEKQYIPQPEKKGVGLAVASMVCGILSLLLACCVPYVPFVLALIGVVLGGVSLHGHRGGKGMAIAGLVCSIISLIPAVFVVIAGAGVMASLGSIV